MNYGKTTLRNSALRHIPIKVSGIYKITNVLDGKFYVGSARNIRRRLRIHLLMLRDGNHTSTHLQHAFNRDGESAFQMEVIELVGIDFLYHREQFWLDDTRCYEDSIGYNICKIAGPPPRALFTPEMRAAISERFKGKPKSEEHRRRIGAAHRGQTRSQEQIEKIKRSLTEHWRSPEARAQQSAKKKGCRAHNKGKKQALEQIEKARASRIAYWSDPTNKMVHAEKMKKRRTVTDDQIRAWKLLRANGESYSKIARESGVSQPTVFRYLTQDAKPSNNS